jgi:hypothetical protein
VKPEPASGDRLTIPPDAAASNDLSFLNGCWIAANTNCSNRQIREEYCFDAGGKGTRTIYHTDGQKFSGPMSARFDARGNLALNVERAGGYYPEFVLCSQSGTLNCRGTVIGENCVYNGVYYRK